MRSWLAAISVLSILPIGKFQPDETDLKRGLNLFPLAGLLFGILLYAAAFAAAALFAPLPAAMVLALLPEALNKGFHLDGAADTADGFLSGRSRERKLEIMRDSRIGSMGVAAIVGVLGMKFALLATLPAAMLPPAMLLAAIGGRTGILFHIATSSYARPEGLAKLWFETSPRAGLLLGTLLSAAAGRLFLGNAGAALPLLIAATALLWSALTRRVIGGATGDTIGCFEELSELLTLAGVAALC